MTMDQLDTQEYEYRFQKPYGVRRTAAVLALAAAETNSFVQFMPDIIEEFDPARGQRTWADKPQGFFQSKGNRGLRIEFSLEKIVDSPKPRFTKVAFSRFDLQEFNDRGRLGAYVNKLVSAMNAYDKK